VLRYHQAVTSRRTKPESPGLPPQRRGRRPGPSTTRAEILAAARANFAELGYDGTSVRGIATRAGVDPALVHRFFGSKDDVLVAALTVDMNPAERIPELMAGDPGALGERLIGYFLGVWEDGPSSEILMGLLRSAATNERAAALLREFIGSQVLSRVADALHEEDAELRATLMSSQLIGIAMLRYVLRYEPLVSASAATITAAYAPTIQRYLTEPLRLG
jgi:AcrR family transcriptional regulator